MTGKEVLQAIANGDSISGFEYTGADELWISLPEDLQVQSLTKDSHVWY